MGALAFFNGEAVATDSSGNVFVTDFTDVAAFSKVFQIATPGTCSTGGTPCTITRIFGPLGDGNFNTINRPTAIATDLSGNVFVTGRFSDNAFRIDTPGTCSVGGTPCTITEIIDETGDHDGTPSSGASELATDSSGNVYATSGSPTAVFKITPGGVKTEIIDGTGDGSNTLTSATGVAT